MQKIQAKYNYLCNSPSDINEHLPVLHKYALDCESVIECGVRGCVSSWAIAYGLLNNNKSKKKMLMNDLTKCNIYELLDATINLPIEIKYEWKNDLDLDVKENFDMVFIDTWHIYGHLKRELAKFSIVTNKYIIMHDTTVDEINGETIRCRWNANKQSLESGYPVEEINCGLGKAITEFLESNTDWVLVEKLTNNNGLTVLKRKTFL
jgi:hypothetical protein